MRTQCDSSAYEKRHRPNFRTEISKRRCRKYRAGRHANECMNEIPYGVDGGDFVRDELDREQRCGRDNDPGMTQYGQITGKMSKIPSLEKAQRQYCRV